MKNFILRNWNIRCKTLLSEDPVAIFKTLFIFRSTKPVGLGLPTEARLVKMQNLNGFMSGNELIKHC